MRANTWLVEHTFVNILCAKAMQLFLAKMNKWLFDGERLRFVRIFPIFIFVSKCLQNGHCQVSTTVNVLIISICWGSYIYLFISICLYWLWRFVPSSLRNSNPVAITAMCRSHLRISSNINVAFISSGIQMIFSNPISLPVELDFLNL